MRFSRFPAGRRLLPLAGRTGRPGWQAPAKVVRKVLADSRDIAENSPKGPHNTFQAFGKIKDGDDSGDNCIDYIYVSEGVRVIDHVTHDDVRPGTSLYPSDHFPITATILLP